jgi:hypothetical protein
MSPVVSWRPIGTAAIVARRLDAILSEGSEGGSSRRGEQGGFAARSWLGISKVVRAGRAVTQSSQD